MVIQSGSDAVVAGPEASSGSVHSDDMSRLETELDSIEQVTDWLLSSMSECHLH